MGTKPLCKASKNQEQLDIDSINELMFLFFSQAKAKNLPLSGPILQSKALVFAEKLGIQEFRASNGWLTSWKQIYISFDYM